MGQIHSMTGFATVRSAWHDTEMTCELRSLNSRYLEVFVKLPPALREFEDAVKEVIRRKLERGKINCSISLNGGEEGIRPTRINERAVLDYTGMLNRIRAIAGIEAPLTLSDLLEFKDIFDGADDSGDRDEVIALLTTLVGDACT